MNERDKDEIAQGVADKLNPRTTPENVRKRNTNPRPQTPLDISHELIEIQLGRKTLPEDVEQYYELRNLDGDKVVKDNAWNQFNIIPTDIRLSNLDPKQPEYEYVQWALKMQGICTLLKLPNSMATCQWLIASVTEPSLAKNMALRNNLQTVRQESQHVQIENPTKSTNILGFIKGGKQ